ncbi:calaxin-like [Physella acuta]|uniref:calaxin-like n=1 Tax=Physella acuta TaxID=109671 RepID=UPI0027DD7708|nr:calaxin-like [Physella acuta]
MTSFKRILAATKRQVNRLVEFSGLDVGLVENILQYAQQLPKQKGGDIDLLVFMAQMSKQFELNSTFLIQSMFESLKKPKASMMTVEEYCRCVCLFLSDNLEIKMDYVFNVYDINRDGSLEWTELYTLLRPCILSTESEDSETDVEDSLRDLIDIVIKITDLDNNGQIDCTEFKKLVKSNILYLQFLGPCLPLEQVADNFKAKMIGKTPYQIKLEFADERHISLCEIKIAPEESQQLYPVPLDLP